MKRSIIILGAGVLMSLASYAQNEADALRYSQLTFGGPARSMGTGGAFGALGGDFSTLSSNPAGIGIYRKSEFTFTPSIYRSSSSSEYLNTKEFDNKYNFNFSNAGFVLTYNHGSRDGEGWISSNFGFGYNRTNNFHNRLEIQGDNSTSSLADAFVAYANGTSYDNLESTRGFDSYLAWYDYLIDTIPGTTNQYFTYANGGGMRQNKSIETSGSMGETVISYGGNYSNRLFMGGTIGFPNIRFNSSSIHEETDVNDTLATIHSFDFTEDVSTSGIGVNFKFGMIYRVNNMLRIGGAVHSPSFFAMSDSYSSALTTKFDNGTTNSKASPNGQFDYRLTTPFRAIGNVGVILMKQGFISADFEFVDYSTAKLNSITYKYRDENDATRDKYQAATNVRLGGEWKYENISFRGGVGYYGNPYKSTIQNDGSKMNYSLGLGIRENGYFIDFAYVMTQSKENLWLYSPEISQPVSNEILNHNFLVTLGFRY